MVGPCVLLFLSLSTSFFFFGYGLAIYSWLSWYLLGNTIGHKLRAILLPQISMHIASLSFAPVCLISGWGSWYGDSSVSEHPSSFCFPLHLPRVLNHRPQTLKAFPTPWPSCYLYCPGWGVVWMISVLGSPPLGSGLLLLILLTCSKLQRQLNI